MMRKLANKYFLIVILIVGSLGWSFVTSLPDHKLHITVFDVGQGDSILITTPEGNRVLIDGGPTTEVINKLGAALPFYEKYLDIVVLTHPHEDHLAGLLEVLKQYHVGQVWMQKVVHTTDTYEQWVRLLKEKHVKIAAPKPGDEISFADGVHLKVLWPPEEMVEAEDLNATSIVLLAEYGRFKGLLTGDAGQESQPYGLDSLWPAGYRLPFLKVPHHGSRTGLRDDFLERIKPEIGVISVGKRNKFGHPSPEILTKLTATQTKIYRTDVSGSVEVVSDGRSWYTRTQKSN